MPSLDKQPALLLFDIDHTLLSTHGKGREALIRAARELFGPHMHDEGVVYGGSLDPLITRAIFRVSNECHSEERVQQLYSRYAKHLADALALHPPTILPGVRALLEHLHAQSWCDLGVLTGNIEPTGRLRLQSVGIDPDRFCMHVWGDSSPHEPPVRAHLVEVALARRSRDLGRPARSDHVVVIGDTTDDVACALAHGCACLGVATGRTSRDELLRAGASEAVEDLSDTPGVADALARLALQR